MFTNMSSYFSTTKSKESKLCKPPNLIDTVTQSLQLIYPTSGLNIWVISEIEKRIAVINL